MSTDQISDDIWEAARALRSAVNWNSNSSVEHIARALLSERQRCARAVCSGCASGVGFSDAGYHQHGSFTFPCHAAAIRTDIQSRQPPSQADRDAGSDEHLPVATGSNSSEVA